MDDINFNPENEMVTVEELIVALKKFNPRMPIIIGAEGVFQGKPNHIEVRSYPRKGGSPTVVLWADL